MSPALQLKVSSRTVVVLLDQQATFGDEPSRFVTAKETLSTVPVEVRSREAAQLPAVIVSAEASGSVKKQIGAIAVRGAVVPPVPCVVLNPLTRIQSAGVIMGPLSCR